MNLFQNDEFIRHCTNVVEHIGQTVHQLDDLENLAMFFNSFNIKIKQHNHQDFIHFFVDTIANTLSSDGFNDQHRATWNKALKIIMESMNKSHGGTTLRKHATTKNFDSLNRND